MCTDRSDALGGNDVAYHALGRNACSRGRRTSGVGRQASRTKAAGDHGERGGPWPLRLELCRAKQEVECDDHLRWRWLPLPDGDAGKVPKELLLRNVCSHCITGLQLLIWLCCVPQRHRDPRQ